MINISPELKACCPEMRLGCIKSDVLVSTEQEGLWPHIDQVLLERKTTLGDTSAIAKMIAIQETRRGYKACGKEPARYRPSAESLLRRVVKDKGLYKVNNVVDLLNLVSVSTGFSIGGYDQEKISGAINAGIGQANEAYEGIGRGALNIEYLPLLRDELGAFGSPTSDSLRTSVQAHTKQFLMVFFSFGPQAPLEEAMTLAQNLLRQYGGAQQLEQWIIS